MAMILLFFRQYNCLQPSGIYGIKPWIFCYDEDFVLQKAYIANSHYQTAIVAIAFIVLLAILPGFIFPHPVALIPLG